jgi:hypothetical protein
MFRRPILRLCAVAGLLVWLATGAARGEMDDFDDSLIHP